MDNLLNPANAYQQRCPRCQSPLNTVVVHGHEQCVICKSNIFECCSGDTCETDHNLTVGYNRGWWCTYQLPALKQTIYTLLWSFGSLPFLHLGRHKRQMVYCCVRTRAGMAIRYVYCLENKGTHAGIRQIAKTHESHESFSINSYWQIAELRKWHSS